MDLQQGQAVPALLLLVGLQLALSFGIGWILRA